MFLPLQPQNTHPNQSMDKYQVHEEWRPGAFGQTCAVEELQGKTRYAVKKVECMDEHQANLALKESMVLLHLRHTNICPYKEFFMTWDNKISSLFLCLVMNYSDKGSLEDMVRVHRHAKSRFDEQTVQILLGQTVDALIYIHKENVVHRNLKPSNILIKDPDTFLISDFMAETLTTDDMKMKIRVLPELKAFLAPETAWLSFEEKSDVWSLGCILLDVMMCSSHTESEASAVLQAIKTNSTQLETVSKTLQDECGYSAELCIVLSQMLQIGPEERVSARDLADNTYVKKCLALIGSPWAGLKKTLPPGLTDELHDGGTQNVLEFMQKYDEYEDAQMAAIRRLSGCLTDPAGSQCDGEVIIHVLGQAMRSHPDSLDIQLEGGRILKHLVSQASEQEEDGDGSPNEDLLITLVGAVRRFPDHVELLSLNLSILVLMSANSKGDETANILGKTGFLRDLLGILERCPGSRDLCLSSCDLMWCLAMAESPETGQLENSIEVIFSLSRENLHDGQLIESACCCLWILCLKGHVAEKQIERVTWLLLESLQAHQGRPVLVKNACLALASLVRASELAAYRLLVPASGASGVSLIIDLYRLHCDDPEIVENICLLLSDMAQYGDTRAELRSQHTDELMREIKVKFESTEEIIVLAESVLCKLERQENHWTNH
uniref:non-specific serine/threonine protein kinase n=1 Tax=Leptobrachium leishanense TaxID=445787 RepID=A0A8C5PW97_9ANUR